MNRQERLAIWRDEVAHPGSPTTWAAMEASGANMTLVDEWRDLEGHKPDEYSSNWMTYVDFLEGAIGIAEEYPYENSDPPAEWSRFYKHMIELWDELAKVTTDRYRVDGSSEAERIRYALSRRVEDQKYVEERWDRKAGTMTASELRCLASVRDRQDIARKEQNARDDANLPNAVTESIIDLPGELYVRYDPQTETFLGFGFTPINDSHPGFSHLDGPEPGCDLTEYDNPVWKGLRQYLENVHNISGEWSFAVQWTEDGWKVKR